MTYHTDLRSNMLSVMMSLSIVSNAEHSCTNEYYRRSCSYSSRYHAIKWMREEVFAAAAVSYDEQDTSIQIFDKFVSYSLLENSSILLNSKFLTFAAAISVILSTKLHCSNPRINMSSFPQFDTVGLRDFERLVLSTIGFNISPLVTPNNFCRCLLTSWDGDSNSADLLLEYASAFVAEFWEEPESVLYAPSTISLSALLLSFSVMKVDCRTWLNTIPDICLPKSSNSYFTACSGAQLFDVDGCLRKFQDLPTVRRNLTPHLAQSPVSVTMSGSISAQTTPITAFHQIMHVKGQSNGDSSGIDDERSIILNNTSTLPPESGDSFLDPSAIEDDADSPCGLLVTLGSKSSFLSVSDINLPSNGCIVKPTPIRSSPGMPQTSSPPISENSFKPII